MNVSMLLSLQRARFNSIYHFGGRNAISDTRRRGASDSDMSLEWSVFARSVSKYTSFRRAESGTAAR